MKTSTINRSPATSRIFTASLAARGLAIACALIGAGIVVQNAGAQYVKKYGDAQQAPPYRTAHHSLVGHSNVSSNVTLNHPGACPPGQQRYQGRCIPDKRPPPKHAPPRHYYTKKSNMTSYGATPLTRSNIHKPKPEMIDRTKVKPQPGVPIEHHSSASNTHGIIFVGGKQALNPQPIPPGHSLHKVPHPSAPIEKIGH